MPFDTQHTASYYAATARNTTPYPCLDGELTADVCVVGGGLTGVNTALELAERGLSVVLLEGRASAGAPAGATAAS
jgi:gamma-glutamylputrescine oxidase